MSYKIVTEIPVSRFQDVLDMIHQSFAEHSKRGIQFTCSNYSLDDLREKVLSGRYLVALSNENDVLGISSYSVLNNGRSAYANITAVSPIAKGLGIGTALYLKRHDLLLQDGIYTLFSDTAVDAKSSVIWHLKKCGCHIVGFESFPSTNYYSYVFREDLIDRGFFVNNIVYPLTFAKSYIKCKFKKRRDGSYTRLFQVYMKIKALCKK